MLWRDACEGGNGTLASRLFRARCRGGHTDASNVMLESRAGVLYCRVRNQNLTNRLGEAYGNRPRIAALAFVEIEFRETKNVGCNLCNLAFPALHIDGKRNR